MEKIKVDSIDGAAELDIPPGTQYGAQIRIPNKGVPHYRRSYSGDLVVVIEIETPKNLNTPEREKLVEFAKLRGESDHSENGGHWKDKTNSGIWDKLLGRHDEDE